MGISVTVKIERSTFFVTLIGIHRAGASAHALAMTDAPDVVNVPIRPFGVPVELLLNYGEGDHFTVGFKNCKPGKESACYIKDAFGNLIDQHRGWMNLGYMWNIDEASAFPRAVDPNAGTGVCNKNPGLQCWMEIGKTVNLFLWDYIHAYPGTDSSAIDDAPLFPDTGTTILLPVYDSVPAYEDIPGPKPEDATQGGGYYYHIVGLAAVHVEWVDQGGGEIEMSLQRYITSAGKLNPTAGAGYNEYRACRTGVQLVTLWR
jgi:hypothetical protein